MSYGKVYLIPTIISEDTQAAVIPGHVREILPGLKYFLVENVRSARRFLSTLKLFPSIEALTFEVLDKDSSAAEMKKFFTPVFSGESIGILSESGCPGIADPGAIAVEYAHEQNIKVIPLVGPSSILLALMASGLNGQQFTFHGYLPIDSKELTKSLKEMERDSRSRRQTQIFIETPHRNNSLIRSLLETLGPGTLLTVAFDLTGREEYVKTLPVSSWRKNPPVLTKMPAIFLFLAR
jgi:16S rRNA (cytidine1402-2'-O)-methyltransferase